MKMCEEMQKLRDMLDAKGIKWSDQSDIMPEKDIDNLMIWCSESMNRKMFDNTIYRTHFITDGKNCSVIYGFGTYGGYQPIFQTDYGLLEMWFIDNGEPIGWLTAEEVMEMCFDDI